MVSTVCPGLQGVAQPARHDLSRRLQEQGLVYCQRRLARRMPPCCFSKFLLPFLDKPSERGQQHPAQPHVQSLGEYDEPETVYNRLLQQAEDTTFNCPASQLHGRAGRRCVLEDAERMLELCIQERPQHLQPWVLLLRNLMRQSLGRERDVPILAIQALQEADLCSAEGSMTRRLQALQIIVLAVKAVLKLQHERKATPVPAGLPTYTVATLLEAAQAAAPAFAADFHNQVLRVQRQLVCCSEEQRLRLLYDRDGYMSSVDLSAVCGQHHTPSN